MMAGVGALIAPSGGPNTWRWKQRCVQDPDYITMIAMGFLERDLRAANYWDGKLGLLHVPAVSNSDPGDWVVFGGGGAPIGDLVHRPGFGATGNATDAGWNFDQRVQDMGNVTSTSYLVGAFMGSNVSGNAPVFGASGGGTFFRLQPRTLSTQDFWAGTATSVQMPAEQAYGMKGFVRTGDSTGYFINFPVNALPSNPRTATYNPGPLSPNTFPVGKATGLYLGGLYSGGTVAAWIVGGAPASEADAEKIARAFDNFVRVLGTRSQIYVPGIPPYSGDGGFAKEEINDITPATLKVMRVAAPPIDEFQTHQRQFDAFGVQTYPPYYTFPFTHCISRPWATFDRDVNSNAMEIIWVDRAVLDNNGNPVNSRFKKPNDTMGLQFIGPLRCGTEFTSYTKAVYSTLVKLAWSAGVRPRSDPNLVIDGTPTGWLDLADEGGFDTSGWDAIVSGSPDVETDPNIVDNTNIYTGPAGGLLPGTSAILHQAYCAANAASVYLYPATIFPNWLVTRDIIILGQRRAFDTDNMVGFLIDDEAADGRSIAEKSFLMDRISRIAKAKKTAPLVPRFPLLVNSNHELGSDISRLSGWDETNAYTINQKFDMLALQVGQNQTTPLAEILAPQIGMIAAGGTVNYSKLMMVCPVGIGQNATTAARADETHDFMVDNNLGGIFIVNIGSTPIVPRSGHYNQTVARWLGLPLTAP